LRWVGLLVLLIIGGAVLRLAWLAGRTAAVESLGTAGREGDAEPVDRYKLMRLRDDPQLCEQALNSSGLRVTPQADSPDAKCPSERCPAGAGRRRGPEQQLPRQLPLAVSLRDVRTHTPCNPLHKLSMGRRLRGSTISAALRVAMSTAARMAGSASTLRCRCAGHRRFSPGGWSNHQRAQGLAET
jgi:hypothetical protein